MGVLNFRLLHSILDKAKNKPVYGRAHHTNLYRDAQVFVSACGTAITSVADNISLPIGGIELYLKERLSPGYELGS